MSSIEPGGIVQFEGDPARRRPFKVLAVLVLLAGAVALYLEPYFVLERVREALRKGDQPALSSLVDPYVLDGPLAAHLEAGRARGDTRVSQQYASPWRFVVTARRQWTVDPKTAASSTVTFRLERRGLGWKLADITTQDETGRSGDDVPPPPLATGDGLPAFGEYVYVEELPVAKYRVAPQYPEIAREAGVEGTVLVQALVGKDGTVMDARISRGIPMLDQAALQAVRQWRFKPAMAKREPVAVWVAMPVRFTLK